MWPLAGRGGALVGGYWLRQHGCKGVGGPEIVRGFRTLRMLAFPLPSPHLSDLPSPPTRPHADACQPGSAL